MQKSKQADDKEVGEEEEDDDEEDAAKYDFDDLEVLPLLKQAVEQRKVEKGDESE